MSLPQCILEPGDSSFPIFISPTSAATMGVPEPQHVSALKQASLMQMSRLLNQLADLTLYSNELFTNLMDITVKTGARIEKLGERMSEIIKIMPEVESELNAVPYDDPSSIKPFYWTVDQSITCNLFKKESKSQPIADAYQKCRPVPNLDVLDEFRNDGKKCMTFYSYPDFFVEEWKKLMLKQQANKKAKSKPRVESVANSPIRSLVKKTLAAQGAYGSETLGEIDENGGENPTNTSNPDISKPQDMMSNNNQSQKSELPPPPPPPPPNVPSSGSLGPPPPPMPSSSSDTPPVTKIKIPPPPKIDTILRDSSNASPNPSIVGQTLKPAKKAVYADAKSSVLDEIRNQRFTLKKATINEKSSRKPSESSDVAAILMRRAALEASESEEDNDDNDGWD